MSKAAEDLASGMAASLAINKLQQALTHESFVLLKSLIGDHIRTEVAAAIRKETAARRKRARTTQPAPLKGPRT